MYQPVFPFLGVFSVVIFVFTFNKTFFENTIIEVGGIQV